MKDLMKALAEERSYVADRLSGIDTNLSERVQKYGYASIQDYCDEKNEWNRKRWNPSVRYIDEDFLDTEMEQAIAKGIPCVYIIAPQSQYYAFHGNDDIDYTECEALDVRVIEMHYNGGTIIGNAEDFGILMVIPKEYQLDSSYIVRNIMRIVKFYVPDAVMEGNDILLDGAKVMGSMMRNVGKVTVWAAQFSFVEHMELIKKVCKKEMKKVPSTFGNTSLTRELLEREVLTWLRKQ